MSYHIEYIPRTHDRTKYLKGNGGEAGREVGTIKYFNEVDSLLSRDGCFALNCPHCVQCPISDCTWDYERERRLAKQLKGTLK